MTKLFKFHTLDSGDDQQKRVKISISEIKASTNEIDPYGSFNVEVRDVKDSDNSPIILIMLPEKLAISMLNLILLKEF